MSLVGTFEVLDFADILGVLARGSRTGRLQIRAGSIHASILIANGLAVGADITGSGRRDSRPDWKAVLEEVCFEALRAERGSFEFQLDPTVEAAGAGDEEGGPAGVKLANLVAASRRRLAAWREVEPVIPSLSVVPRLAEEGLKADSLNLDKDRWRLVVSIDGRRSITGLARRLGLDPLKVCQLLKPLVEDGAVVVESLEPRIKSLPTVPLRTDGLVAHYDSDNNGIASRREEGDSEKDEAESRRPWTHRLTGRSVGQPSRARSG